MLQIRDRTCRERTPPGLGHTRRTENRSEGQADSPSPRTQDVDDATQTFQPLIRERRRSSSAACPIRQTSSRNRKRGARRQVLQMAQDVVRRRKVPEPHVFEIEGHEARLLDAACAQPVPHRQQGPRLVRAAHAHQHLDARVVQSGMHPVRQAGVVERGLPAQVPDLGVVGERDEFGRALRDERAQGGPRHRRPPVRPHPFAQLGKRVPQAAAHRFQRLRLPPGRGLRGHAGLPQPTVYAQEAVDGHEAGDHPPHVGAQVRAERAVAFEKGNQDRPVTPLAPNGKSRARVAGPEGPAVLGDERQQAFLPQEGNLILRQFALQEADERKLNVGRGKPHLETRLRTGDVPDVLAHMDERHELERRNIPDERLADEDERIRGVVLRGYVKKIDQDVRPGPPSGFCHRQLLHVFLSLSPRPPELRRPWPHPPGWPPQGRSTKPLPDKEWYKAYFV